MAEWIRYLQANTQEVLLGMAVVQILLIIAWIVNTVRIKRTMKKYDRLVKGTEKRNLEEILMDHLAKVEHTQEVLKSHKKELQRLEEGAAGCLQKVYTKRYNAFDNTGSDLSYSTAFLDARNTGLILTGIYGRDYAVSYAKPVDNGVAKQVLSKEEEEALAAAKNQEIRIKTDREHKKK